MKNLLFIILFLPSLAFAQDTPEKVLEKILADIKAAANTSPVVEYVDWQKAFDSMPEERRKMIKADTPEAMKEYYAAVLKDPVGIMKKQFEERLESLPPSQKSVYEQNFAKMQKTLEEKTKEMFDRIAETEYTVGKAEINGDSADVPLKRIYKQEVADEKVHFEKSGDKWMLPAVSSMGSGSSQQKQSADSQ